MAKSSLKGELNPTMLIMPKLWKSMKVRSQYMGHVIMRHWQEIVGENIANNVIPVRYENGSLFLSASSSSWLNEIMLMKLDIIDKINHYAGEYAVKELVFQGNARGVYSGSPHKNGGSVLNSEDDNNYITLNSVDLSNKEIEAINSSCQNIRNSELRSRVARNLLDMKRLSHMHSKSGWHKCQRCGHLVAPRYKMCLSCENISRGQHRSELREYLKVVPWATYADVCNDVSRDIEDKDFIDCKKELIQDLARKLKFSDQDTVDGAILAMLKTGCPVERLTKDVIYKAFKRLRYDLADASEFFDKKRLNSGSDTSARAAQK